MDRTLTVPNLISVARLCCVPWFVWLLFGADEEIQAAVLLAVLGCTDWVDGYIARRLDQVSTVGKVLDPTADRLLLATAAISVLIKGAVPLWFGITELTREGLVVIAGLVLWMAGATRIDVQFVGKAGAFLLMVSLPLFLLGDAGHDWAKISAFVIGVPGLACNWFSMIGYAKRAQTALKVGRTSHPLDRVDKQQ